MFDMGAVAFYNSRGGVFMKKAVTFLILILLGSFLVVSPLHAKEYQPQFESEAEVLKELGLFKGTEQGFELERQPTRLEALMMLLRMLGLEEEAKAETSAIPFQDVNDWWKPYVAYAYKNKLTLGVSETEFGSTTLANEQMFVTFVLRSLGYSDSKEGNADFTYEKAVEKALETGLLTEAYLQNKPNELMRDGCVAISTQALKTNMKDKDEILLSKLLDSGVVDETKAKKLLSDAEYYAVLAAKAYKKRQVSEAEEYYLKAVELDPTQAKYYAGLAEIYQWMARPYTNNIEKESWIEKQKTASEQAVKFAPNNVNYVENLMAMYFDLKDYEKGLEQAEVYLTLVKKKEDAYEWLAKGYCEFGLELIKESKIEDGKEQLNNVIDLLENKTFAKNKIIGFYAGKAYLAFGNFEQAKQLFESSSSSSNLIEIRLPSFRLIYLINEETGLIEENEKLKAREILGMGSVTGEEKSDITYLEMKEILNSKVLA